MESPQSPRSHRALRRLQSAQNLGSRDSRTSTQPSPISQQRQQLRPPLQLQNTILPIRKDPSLRDPTLSYPESSHLRGRSNSDAAGMNLTGTGRKQGISKKIAWAHEPTSLDRLIRDGPPEGDLAVGLESTRLKILDQGIKSDSDGMVGFLIHQTEDLPLIGLSLL
jgi:cell cycle arrest protein BUB2